MTPKPVCCTASDTVGIAAQLMKQEDVGSIPVVDNPQSMMLVGIVTDRDLAMKVLAENRNPQQTLVQDVMTANLVTCYSDDELIDTLDLMSEHQVRRIPVIDHQGHIVGIISQADIALRAEDEQKTAEVVEEISKPTA
jgi:CBS domain-containing protein